ncbi:DExH-box splicing factor-binding site protein [Toxoplasma gondii RUB]|uniref:DExH-box splicing factor-binding site protein n=1 Tax=Toxoplasma gondii RUB TaxID=935652 RepID=A0A086LV82_TOXGO|nr:DExH-box splicing factor-binding site protein [Toxoplasma gondii RUB]
MAAAPQKISFSFGKKTPASSSSSSSSSRPSLSFSLSSQRGGAGPAAGGNAFQGRSDFFKEQEEKQVAIQQVLSISKDGEWETEGGEEEPPPLVIPCLNRLDRPPSASSVSSDTNEPEKQGLTNKSGGAGGARDEKKEPNYLLVSKHESDVKNESETNTELGPTPAAPSEAPLSASPKPEYGLTAPKRPPVVKSEPDDSSASSSSSPSASLDDLAAQALIAEARGEYGSGPVGTAAPILPILSRNEKLAELRRRHKERVRQAKQRASSRSSPSGVRGRGFVAFDPSSGASAPRLPWEKDANGVKEEREDPDRDQAFGATETSEKELLQEELNLLPDALSATSAEYSRIPVSEFGLAMLRGMGYDAEKKEETTKGAAPKRKRTYNRAGLGSEEEVERLWEEREQKLREEAARDKKRKMDELLRRRREG